LKAPLEPSCVRQEICFGGKRSRPFLSKLRATVRAFLLPLEIDNLQETTATGISKLRIAGLCFPAALRNQLPPETIMSLRLETSNCRSSFPAAERGQLVSGNDQVRSFKASFPSFVLSFCRSKTDFRPETIRTGFSKLPDNGS
jgi:hypothetical protein